MTQKQATSLKDIFAGDSKMAALMRTFNWSQTPLGSVADWSQSLRVAVSILLAAKLPMQILWGSDYTQLYNDLFLPLLGTKHPKSLGQKGCECWQEIWDSISSCLERVRTSGQANWLEDQLLVINRKGFVEECYFTFCYTPVRDESGAVGGVLNAVRETTFQVINKRRHRIQSELVARIATAQTTEEVCVLALEVLANNPADIPFALLYLLDTPKEQAYLVETIHLEPGTPASPQLVNLGEDDSLSPWSLSKVARMGLPELVEGLNNSFPFLPCEPWGVQSHSAFVLPIAFPGQEHPSGFLVAGLSPYLAFDSDYRRFLETLGTHIAMALASLCAFKQEHNSSKNVSTLNQANRELLARIDAHSKLIKLRQETVHRKQPLPVKTETVYAEIGSILESITDAFVAVDSQWRYTYANTEAVNLLQKTQEELLFKEMWEVFPDTVGTQFEREYRRSLTEQVTVNFEEFYSPYGIWLEVRACPFEKGLAIYFRDITQRKRAEDALRQSEERLRVALKTSPISVFHQDRNLCYTWIYNPSFGYKVDDVLGKRDADLIPRSHAEALTQIKSRVLETGVGVRQEIKLSAFNQDWYYDLTVEPLRNANNEITGVTGAAIDISESKQTEIALRKSEQRFRIVQELSLDAFTVLISVRNDAKKIIDFEWVYVNPKAAEILGHPAESLVGKRLLQVMPGNHENSELFDRYVRVVETGEPHDIEISYDSDGILGWFRNMAVKLDDGIAISFSDISQRKKDEQERMQLLERERAARAEAESANHIKDEFLAVLSHELRSPLNPILGWAKMLRTRKYDEKATNRALETIERNAKLQAQLIEDLLDVSRILRGKLVLNVCPVNLVTIIEAAIETVHLAAEAKGIQIQTVLDSSIGLVSGDTNRLQQVFWNLLSNAVKFTPNGGRVEVRLERVGHHAQIHVIDNGKGINLEFLPHVFEYFRQENSSTTRKFGGLGLGLAIVRYLTEMHGGSVRAHSQGEDLGATFTVSLPIIHNNCQSQALSSIDPHSAPYEETFDPTPHLPLKGLRILIVDDEADIRELVAFILEESGSFVTVTKSAAEALAAIGKSVPDLLVCDIGMPNMDGYMLLRQIRASSPEQGSQIPAIALTAYAGEYNQQQALTAGFQMHISKPVDPDELLRAIASLVDSQ
ncbi:hypothetical protein NUACC21_78870 [Scytonema sp. NUACC21]